MVGVEEQEKPFKKIKRALVNAPALDLPDVMRLGTVLRVLTQLIGSWNCLVAYLPKQLDAVS
jgi:hypothetical protein